MSSILPKKREKPQVSYLVLVSFVPAESAMLSIKYSMRKYFFFNIQCPTFISCPFFQDRKLKFSASFGKRISSWNLTKFQLLSSFRQFSFPWLSDWFEIFWSFMYLIHFQKDAENFSFLSWKKKSFIPKKYII